LKTVNRDALLETLKALPFIGRLLEWIVQDDGNSKRIKWHWVSLALCAGFTLLAILAHHEVLTWSLVLGFIAICLCLLFLRLIRTEASVVDINDMQTTSLLIGVAITALTVVVLLPVQMISQIFAARILAFSALLAALFFFLLHALSKRQSIVSLLNKQKTRWFLICLVLTVTLSLAYALIFFNNTFPLTEGWYSVFAKAINSGLRPYVDFDFHFPPTYAYIIAGITKIFGYEILVLRIVGVLLFGVLALLSYLIFSKLFKPTAAMIASVVAVLFIQAQIGNTYYDYIQFYNLFTYLALLFVMMFIATLSKHSQPVRSLSLKLTKYGINLPVFLAGIFSSLALLTRQSSGAIVIFFIFVFLIFFMIVSGNKRQCLPVVLNYLLAVCAPLALLAISMTLDGSLQVALSSVSGDALPLKGGLTVVLFGWIKGYLKSVLADASVIAVVTVFLVGIYLASRYLPTPQNTEKYELVTAMLFAVLLGTGVILCYYVSMFAQEFVALRYGGAPNLVYTIIILLFLFALLKLCQTFRKRQELSLFYCELFFLSGAIVAIGYGSGTSGGLSEGQTALGAALLIGLMFHLCSNKALVPLRIFSLALSLSLLLGITSFKYDIPYSWWGYRLENLRIQDQPIMAPNLHGIYTTALEKEVIEGVTDDINQFRQSDDDVFVFPHMPIFYLTSDTMPRTYTIVQWFDVTAAKAVDADMTLLEETPPRIIVMCHLPEEVMLGHETAFSGGHESPLRKMDAFLQELVRSGGYTTTREYPLPDGYLISVYVKQ
jgi:hypothetical protein